MTESRANQRGLEDDNLHNIQNFLSKTSSEDFPVITSNMASSLAESAVTGKYGQSINLINKLCSETSSKEKEFTILTPKDEGIKSEQTVHKEMSTSEYYIPEDIPLDLRCKLAQSLIYCKELDGISVSQWVFHIEIILVNGSRSC